MWSRAYEDAARRYSIEVEHVAAELIERGMPPWGALDRAFQIVRERREQAASRKPLRRTRGEWVV